MCSLHLELVSLWHSFLLCNVALFYSFSKSNEKEKKIKYTPKRGREKYFLFIDSTMSHPWTKHILPFVRQSLGFNMTLGSRSHYIELCPPPFGYSSKHMESLQCLLHHELMSKYHAHRDCLLSSCLVIPKAQSSLFSKSMKPSTWSSKSVGSHFAFLSFPYELPTQGFLNP